MTRLQLKLVQKTIEIFNNALREKINLRNIDDKMISIAFDEAKKLNDVNTLLKIFGISKEYNKQKK